MSINTLHYPTSTRTPTPSNYAGNQPEISQPRDWSTGKAGDGPDPLLHPHFLVAHAVSGNVCNRV